MLPPTTITVNQITAASGKNFRVGSMRPCSSASSELLEGNGCSREGQAPYAGRFGNEPLLSEERGDLCINFVLGRPLNMTVPSSITGAASR